MTTTKKASKTVFLSVRELADSLDEASQNLLGMRGWEFFERAARGEVEDSFSAHYVRTMLNLAQETDRRDIFTRLRGLAEQDAQHDSYPEPADVVGGESPR